MGAVGRLEELVRGQLRRCCREYRRFFVGPALTLVLVLPATIGARYADASGHPAGVEGGASHSLDGGVPYFASSIVCT